jgi:hypothetical protein
MASPHRKFADFQDAGWRTGLFRSLLIALLAASAVAAPVAVLRLLVSWPMAYLLPVAFLAALIGVFDTVRLGRPDWRDRRGLVFRLGEIMLLMVVAQLAIWSCAAGWPTGAEVARWLRHPDVFFSGELIVTGMLLLSAWGLAVSATGDFLDLAIQPDEVAARESHEWGDTRSQWRVFRPVGRGEIVGRFAKRWVWGGVVLVMLAALSGLSVTQDAASILKFSFSRPGLPPDVVAGLLCYFLSGLLLLSDARLAVLRGRWYNEEVEIAPGVMRRWHVTGTFMVLAVAAAALLLPLGSTAWLGQALEWLINLTIRIMMMLQLLFFLLITLLSYPFHSLLKPGNDEAAVLLQRPILQIPPEIEAARRLPDWLGGALLWVVVVLVGGYLVAVYLRSHGRLTSFGGVRLTRLRFWWRSRRTRFSRAMQTRVAALQARRARSRSGQTRAAERRMRSGELRPRERIRDLYLQAIHQAAERGLARPAHRTPLEFADDLEVIWPDAESAVQALTEAFLDARYTPHDIPVAEAESAQSAWQRLMAALRRPARRNADRDS